MVVVPKNTPVGLIRETNILPSPQYNKLEAVQWQLYKGRPVSIRLDLDAAVTTIQKGKRFACFMVSGFNDHAVIPLLPRNIVGDEYFPAIQQP